MRNRRLLITLDVAAAHADAPLRPGHELESRQAEHGAQTVEMTRGGHRAVVGKRADEREPGRTVGVLLEGVAVCHEQAPALQRLVHVLAMQLHASLPEPGDGGHAGIVIAWQIDDARAAACEPAYLREDGGGVGFGPPGAAPEAHEIDDVSDEE